MDRYRFRYYLLNLDFYSVNLSFMETFNNVPILRQIKVDRRFPQR